MGSRIIDKRAWREFLLISLLLTLALGLAIASSALLRLGNIWVSRALAVLSLLIAAFVTKTFVPRLARRANFWGRPVPSFGITKEGSVYLLMILIIAVSALNTGNNLLFLVLAVLLSGIVSSGVISRLSLKGVAVSMQIPDHISAGDPVAFKITLKNQKRLMPSFSLTVEGYQRRSGALRRWMARWRGRGLWRSKTVYPGVELPPNRTLLADPVYFPLVPARKDVSQTVMHVFSERGRYVLSGFKITTRFPFGFFKKSQRVEAEGEALVYPRIYEISADFQRLPFWNGHQPSSRRGLGDELYSYRKYQPGDDARFVDWKATAKMSQLVLKDFTKEDDRRVCVIFDPHRYEDTPAFAAQFERAVSLAAGVAAHFIQEGIEVEFVLPQQTIPPGVGRLHLYRILALLAGVQPVAYRDPVLSMDEAGPAAVRIARDRSVRQGFKIIITGRPRGELSAAVERDARVIAFDEINL